MAWQDVYRKYDAEGNVIDELKFTEGTPEYEAAKNARESGGGQVGDWYIKEGTGDIHKKNTVLDQTAAMAEYYTPRIKINDEGTGLVISGPSIAVNSDMAKQLQSYLDETFKYADLRSTNVADAINKLNQDVYSQIEQRISDDMLQVPYDDYKEYKEAMQNFQGTNPLKSTGAVPGYLKNGTKIASKGDNTLTVADWLKYYQDNYSAKERAELFIESMNAMMSGDTDFAKYTPYLVMSGGSGSSPVYGFSAAERVQGGVDSLIYNTVGKLFEGAATGVLQAVNPFSWQGYGRKNSLNDIAHDLGHADDVSEDEIPWISEEEFNRRRDALVGKDVNSLSKEEQAFLAALMGDKLMGGWFGAGRDTKDFITEEGDSNAIDGDQLSQFSYQDYINARDNFATITGYSKELKENVETPFRGMRENIDAATLYAPFDVGVGTFIGTMMRFYLESGLISGFTGGTFNPMSLSDDFAEGIASVLAKSGLVASPETLSKGVGNFLLRVAAEVPEDIIQTAIDDVVTGHADEVGTLLTPDSIADNTVQNLIMRLAFTPAHAGYQWVKDKIAIQKAAAEAGMAATVPDALFENARKVQQAADGVPGAGNLVDATENSATIEYPDGHKEVLDNVAMLHFADGNMAERYPEYYEILRKKGLVADIVEGENTLAERIESAKKAIEAGEYSFDASIQIESLFGDVDNSRYKTPQGYVLFGSEKTTRSDSGDFRNLINTFIKPGGKIDTYNPALRSGKITIDDLIGMLTDSFESDLWSNSSIVPSSVVPGGLAFTQNGSLGRAFLYGKWLEERGFDLSGSPSQNNPAIASLIKEWDEKYAEKDIANLIKKNLTKSNLLKGTDKLKTPTTLYRMVSTTGNSVNEAGDFSWATSTSFSDDGFAFLTLDESYTPGYGRSGKNYLLRYHLPEGQGIYYFADEDLGGAESGGTLVLPPIDDARIVRTGEISENGDEILDVFVGKEKTKADTFAAIRGLDTADSKTTYLLKDITNESYTLTNNLDEAFSDNGNVQILKVNTDSIVSPVQANRIIRDAREFFIPVRNAAEPTLRNIQGETATGELYQKITAINEGIQGYERGNAAPLAEAIARYDGKPVVTVPDSENGIFKGGTYYISGIDKAFDEDIATQSLAATTTGAQELSRMNLAEARKVQQALDTEPYGRTIEEIVADKYKKGAATINDAPDSSSYRWESPDVTKTYNTEAEVFADMPTGKNLTEVRQWEKNAHAFYMNRYMQETMPEFTERYPTVDEQQQFVRNMDYLFDLQRIDGETLESAVGKTFENEGVVYTVSQEDIDFYQNYIEPQMTGLREAGAAAIGKEAFTITGYLPHSDYDPTILTAEDSMQQGVLWREYSGASTTDESGNFSTGWLNPDLTARYSTFVHNMLWDSLGDNVTVAKYMEEFNADGLDIAANVVERMVGGRKRLAHLVSESDSVKAVVKNLLGDGELPTEAQLEKAAKDLGSTDIIHDLYRPVYGEAKGLYQTKSAASVKLMSKSDWMRSLATGDGTLYDNGGAMIVNGAADAKFLAKRITDAIDNGEKLDTHQMFVEYLMQNQRRTARGADYIADKWMDKIAQKADNGGISRRALTAELNSLIYGEGANRLFRFIGRMDTSQLTPANKQILDSLLFRHSALSKVKNTSGISANINKWTNRLISARMKSLFWLNYKNAVLQASECIRLFTEFKFGDAKATIRKLATDADFRTRVDEWVDMLVPERFVKSDSAAATGALDTVVSNSSFKNGELTINKLSADDLRKFGEKIDEFGRAPVELGETMKNRVLMAGILQEADRKGLTGNELFNYVNQRFERIGLAANEMGRLNASDNPLFRIGANLKTFQIRQFRMFLNNIHDMNGTGEAATYIIKNLGWKLGLALIMGKLGYSTAATLGIDPFDLMDDDYTGVDEENYTGLDYAMLSPAAKLFLSGGFTGYINDAYWAARKAYEDSATVTEQTENKTGDSFWAGVKMPEMSFDNVFSAFSGFIPGFTAGKRVYQMNELMDTGWATSASGNQMYQAPNNPLDVATGYLFGRSNTPNARAYYQTPDYLQGFLDNGLAGIGQQLGREFGGYRQFDPIDTQNYSDWFNGTAADEQQWNSGYYYFRNKMDDLQKEYQNSLSGFTTDQDETQLSESFNKRMAEIEEQLSKFTAAYEAKHPEGIDARKMRNLTTILNLYQPVMGDTDEERRQRKLDATSEALYRYSQAGLPAVTSYKRNDEGEVEPVYSPQLRSALQGEYGLPEEAAAQIRRLYNDKWKELGKQYRDRVFSTKGTKNKQAIQKEYINIVRQDLDPIVYIYGNNIWSNEDIENIIDDVFNSMIPKYGQSAKSYLKELYRGYSGQIRYNEKGNTVLTQINQLLDQGKTAQAKALARSLRQRVQENKTSLTRAELERLQKILNE